MKVIVMIQVIYTDITIDESIGMLEHEIDYLTICRVHGLRIILLLVKVFIIHAINVYTVVNGYLKGFRILSLDLRINCNLIFLKNI